MEVISENTTCEQCGYSGQLKIRYLGFSLIRRICTRCGFVFYQKSLGSKKSEECRARRDAKILLEATKIREDPRRLNRLRSLPSFENLY